MVWREALGYALGVTRGAWVLAGIVAVTSAVGCSLFTSIDGVSGGQDPADAATASDANIPDVVDEFPASDAAGGNDAVATSDADASLPNLHPNGGFELVNANGCGAEWGVFQGSGTRVSEAHTGTYACKACGTNTMDSEISELTTPAPSVPDSAIASSTEGKA